VDQHFRQADRFEIVDLEGDRYVFVETRLRQTDYTTGHDTGVFDDIVRLLADCEGVFVSQIGIGAARYLNSIGLRVFEAPYPVEAGVEMLLEDRIFEQNTQREKHQDRGGEKNHDI
jgi:predicted Fe-Mo cluster-binding NifX family protein